MPTSKSQSKAFSNLWTAGLPRSSSVQLGHKRHSGSPFLFPCLANLHIHLYSIPSRSCHWVGFLYLSLNYPWSGILEYIIAYCKVNQNAMADTWFDPNTILISQYLTLHQEKPAAVPHQSSGGAANSGGGGTKFPGGSKSTSSIAKPSNKICVMFNRAAGCQWPQNHPGGREMSSSSYLQCLYVGATQCIIVSKSCY